MNDTAPPDAARGSAITIIKTRLPYLDRRSLSEAWFSALHLSAERAQASRRQAARCEAAGEGRAETARGPSSKSLERPGERALQTPHGNARRGDGASVVSPPSSKAKGSSGRARATFETARSYPAFRTSLTVGVRKHRVQLLLRRDGATLHVVALCRPEIADVVRRALASADARARGCGESVRSSIHMLGAPAADA